MAKLYTASDIEAIAFDFGNVLKKVDGSIFPKALLKHTDIPIVELYKMVRESQLSDSFELGEITFREYYEKLSRLCNINIDENRFGSYFLRIFGETNNELIKIVDKLRDRFATAVLSNTNEVHANLVIKDLCKDHFDRVVLSYEIGSRKPDPRAYLVLAKKLGCTYRGDYKKILFIDDKMGNVHGAVNSGLSARLFIDNNKLLRDFERLGISL